jgi:hypothetical protein
MAILFAKKMGFALKATSPCHSERSEESVLSSFGNGFFVTTFLRMTFEAKPKKCKDKPPLYNQSQ